MAQKPRLCRFQSLGPHGFHQVAYTEWGDPHNDRIVVCVHGLNRNSRDFDALATTLADRFRIVCMDVVGRGSSDWLRHKGELRVFAFSCGRGGSSRADHRTAAVDQIAPRFAWLASCQKARGLDRDVHGRTDRPFPGGKATFTNSPPGAERCWPDGALVRVDPPQGRSSGL